MNRYISIVVLFLLFTNYIHAKANIKLVDEYLEVSGAKEIILKLPNQIEKGYKKSIKNRELKDIDIKSKFDSKRTISYIRDELRKNFRDDLLKQIIAFYKSPLGKKYKKNGIDAMSEKELKKRAIFFQNIKKTPPSFDRINVMNAFVDRLELTPISVHLIGELLGSLNAQLASCKNSEDVLSSVSEKIRENLFKNSLYAYGDFSSRELKQVMNYYYTNAGRFEQLIVSKIFKQLIRESFIEITEEKQKRLASVN